MTITIGCDPGLTGAIALLAHETALIDVYDMPVIAGQVNPYSLKRLEDWHSSAWGKVVLEDVHGMPGQGTKSVFGFGRTKGVIEGVFACADLSIVYVSPARWKKALGLSKDKGASRRRAIELWPDKASLFARVKDDGRAEAALIAYWWLTHGDGAR